MHWHRVLYLPAGCGDDLAAGVDDEETHDGDANLTDEEQRGHNPAEHCVAEFVEDSGDDQRAAGEQLICDWVHELAQFGDLVIFAGHPTVELIGAGGDDEDNRRHPAHSRVFGTPCACHDVQRQEDDDQDDTRESDDVRRGVPPVKQGRFAFFLLFHTVHVTPIPLLGAMRAVVAFHHRVSAASAGWSRTCGKR